MYAKYVYCICSNTTLSNLHPVNTALLVILYAGDNQSKTLIVEWPNMIIIRDQRNLYK